LLFNIAVHHGPEYLLVVCAGRSTLADLLGAADLIARIAAVRGYRRALIDLTATEPELAFTEHLQLGAHVAASLAFLDRVSTVVSPRYRTGVSEKAAQKEGLRLRTFTSLEEAQMWMGDAPGEAATPSVS
jgi:hypothetical protein